MAELKEDKHITFKVSLGEFEEIQAFCCKEKYNLSEFVRTAIFEYLDNNTQNPPLPRYLTKYRNKNNNSKELIDNFYT